MLACISASNRKKNVVSDSMSDSMSDSSSELMQHTFSQGPPLQFRHQICYPNYLIHPLPYQFDPLIAMKALCATVTAIVFVNSIPPSSNT